MNKYHKLFAKLFLLVVVWVLISLVAPWALSVPDTMTNVLGAVLVVVPAYITVFMAVPEMVKSFYKAAQKTQTKTEENV